MPSDLIPQSYRLLMTADAVGGVWRYALDAARELGRANVDATLAVLGPPPSPEQRDEAAAVGGLRLIETCEPLDWLCESRGDIRKAAQTIAQLARDARADLVQLNGTALAADAEFCAPVAAVHHSCLATWWANVKSGPLPADWIWRREAMRDHLQRADAVAAPTRIFAEQTAAAYNLSRTPRVIHNGRPPPPVGDREPAPALFTAGRLWDEGKNIATIERAARRIAAPVFAAGPSEGPQGASGAMSSIRRLGVLGEAAVRARLAERPIFVSTPLYEPFGLAVLEAAQAGCALILSDIPTLRELWDGAALFIEPSDDLGLAEIATRLLRDPRLREEQGAAARERSARYSARAFGDALLAWHGDVLARSRGNLESAA